MSPDGLAAWAAGCSGPDVLAWVGQATGEDPQTFVHAGSVDWAGVLVAQAQKQGIQSPLAGLSVPQGLDAASLAAWGEKEGLGVAGPVVLAMTGVDPGGYKTPAGGTDYAALAAAIAAKQAGAVLPSDCGRLPSSMGAADLARYAAVCGENVVADLVLAETGIDPRSFVKNGAVDWLAVGGAVVTLETGVALAPSSFLNPDGSPNWQGVAATAGAVAGAAICSALGVTAIAAPLCSFVGSLLGRAIYAVGAAFASAVETVFSSGTSRQVLEEGPVIPTVAVAAAGAWYVANRPAYTLNVLALRGIALSVVDTVEKMRGHWASAVGVPMTWAEMYGKLVDAGLEMPFGWGEMIGIADGPRLPPDARATPGNPFESPNARQPDHNNAWTEWMVANYAVSNAVSAPSDYDNPLWWNHPLTLGQFVPDVTSDNMEFLSMTVHSAWIDAHGTHQPAYVNQVRDPWILFPPSSDLSPGSGNTWQYLPYSQGGSAVPPAGQTPAAYSPLQALYASAMEVNGTVYLNAAPDLRPLLETSSPNEMQSLRLLWLGSLEQAVGTVRSRLRQVLLAKQSRAVVVKDVKIGALVAVGALAALGAWRYYHGLSIVPRHLPEALRKYRKNPEDETSRGPAWAIDKATWQRAYSVVRPRWNHYEHPYAVVARVYENMGGRVRPGRSR